MNCDMDVLKVLAQRGLFRTLFVAQLLVVTLAKAETQNIDGRTWTYSVSNGEATITKAPEGTKDLIIPSALGGFPVVRIGSWAMGYYNWLSSPIVIPEGVRSIGDGAFAYCTWLPSVSIPSTVTNIEENAFYSCNKMTSVYIANLTKWCAISFGARSANPLCENNRTELYVKGELVRDLVIPYGVKRVNDYAFCGWDKSVKIPESVVSIGKEAFSWNKGLVEVVIPSSVTNIDMTAFAQCTGLEKIYVEESNITYSSYDGMMYDKEGATLKLCPEGRRGVVTIPDGVREIGRKTFGDCAQITAVYMPLSMRRIGEYAFYGCDGLTSITIPVGVTTIDRWAFQGCDNLMSVSIPSTVKDVGIDAFSNWSSLKTIYVEADDVDRIVLLLTASGLDLTKVEIIPVAYRTITFDATGGSVECCQMSVVEGSVLGELPMAEREGWMFLGWFTTAIGGMNVSSDSVVTSDLILYAHWQVRVYKVTLNLNYENKHEEHMREYGSCIGDLGIPQRPGYTFAGWFTEANGGSAISSDLVVTDEVVCYAHWVVNTYCVVFNMNYEGGEIKGLNIHMEQILERWNSLNEKGISFLAGSQIQRGANRCSLVQL